MKTTVLKVTCFAIIVMVAVTFSVSAGGGKEEAKKTGDETYLVACLSYQTGFGWDQGKGEYWGMHLAIDEINKAGGVLGKQVEYVDIHLGYTNEEVISAFKKAASYNPIAIVGGQEAGGQDAAAATQREIGLPQCVLYACSGKLTQPGYFYGAFHTNIYPHQFLQPIKKLIEDGGGKTLAVVMDDCGYGHVSAGVIENFWPNGPQKVAAVEWYSWTGMYEIGPQVLRALSYKPDVLHVGMWSEAGAVGLAKQLRELRYEGLVTFDCGGLNDALVKAVAESGESLEGVYGVRTWMVDPDIPESIEFDKAFKAWPETDGIGAWDYAVGGYIGMKSMLMAMNIAGTTTDRLAIADAMYDNQWITPYGEPALWFPGGQFFAPYTYLGVVKDGKIVLGVKKKLTPEDYNEPYPWYDAYEGGMAAYKKQYRK